MFSKLVKQRHWLTKTSLGHLNQQWWSFEFCSPMHTSAWWLLISMPRGGSFRERIRRCVTLALTPGRAAHLRCCAQVFCGPAAPPHSPNLRTLVHAPRCAAPPDALFAVCPCDEGLVGAGGAPREPSPAPDGSSAKRCSRAPPPTRTAAAQQQHMV